MARPRKLSPRRRRARFWARLLVALLVLALIPILGISLGRATEGEPPPVVVLSVEGVINPLTARYLENGLTRAHQRGAQLAVVRLDTPGGLESSMRVMIEAILDSRVPVAVHVAPPGARAASAGMFLTVAGHLAVMAPGTNIGAAHPVGLGGDIDEVAAAKAVNDAAALARSVAELRGRNADWAEEAVRDSVSLTASEALAANVVDGIAEDLEELLAFADRRTVVTTEGPVTLRLTEAPRVDLPMSLPERLMQVATDPNVAYLLFTLGVLALMAELYNPGMLIPGVVGVVSLVIAFVAFGSLPIGWAGIVLIALSAGLFIAELQTEGIGVMAALGLAAFVVGSLLLYTPVSPVSPVMPEVQVSPWLIVVVAAVIAALLRVVLRALVRARRAPGTPGSEAMIGRVGEALTDLAPEGRVRVDGENWRARVVIPPGEPWPLEETPEAVPRGEQVDVVSLEGVTLLVRPRAEEPMR